MIAGEAINVLDYGAVGDGVTDDMQAIMDAINAAAPGQAVYFPAGVYFVDPPTDV